LVKFGQTDDVGALGGALSEHFGWKVQLRDPSLDVAVHLNDAGLLLTLTLLRRPDSIEGRSRAARGLDSLVAWAMSRCAAPLPPGSLVLDPMCGAGATLIEALAANPCCIGIGIDMDEAQLARAIANRSTLPAAVSSRLSLLQGDARALPLPLGRCDCVLCDLPWGPQFGSPDSLAQLYPRAMKECARMLQVGRRAIFLIDDKMLQALRISLPAAGLRLLAERHCPIGETKAFIVVTEKVEGDLSAESQGLENQVATRRLEWESAEGRSEWTALRKAYRPPMVPAGAAAAFMH